MEKLRLLAATVCRRTELSPGCLLVAETTVFEPAIFNDFRSAIAVNPPPPLVCDNVAVQKYSH